MQNTKISNLKHSFQTRQGNIVRELKQISENTRKSYDLAADKYHELFKDEMNQKEFDRSLLDKFASYFDSQSVICDVGCGPSGHIARYLFNKGLSVFGVDISEKCIEIARRENPMMKFHIMDMTKLDIANSSIDGIISFYSVIHTPKQFMNVVFNEFNRILKKGGKILLVVKKGNSEGYTNELLGYRTHIYFTYFTEKEIENYLKSSGFRISYLETREPYDFEISNPRIYAIGEKLQGGVLVLGTSQSARDPARALSLKKEKSLLKPKQKAMN